MAFRIKLPTLLFFRHFFPKKKHVIVQKTAFFERFGNSKSRTPFETHSRKHTTSLGALKKIKVFLSKKIPRKDLNFEGFENSQALFSFETLH